ncbi:MAG: site-specific DNA-methyltransferase, partial [Anaerolineales bacterium]
MSEKGRSSLNKTISLNQKEVERLSKNLRHLNAPVKVKEIQNTTINQDLFSVINFLPEKFVDLLFIDPPYNLTKDFNG